MSSPIQESSPNSPTIGVVAISYNEERDLQRFIDHLLPWVDEIVIIDDGSNDKTSEIAKSGGSKVNFIVAPRKEGEFYSHQRNKGIDAAKSDWLLHMDIDERVPTELANEIQSAIENENYDGYRFRRLNFYLHRPFPYGGWQHWNLIHLARRSLFRFGGKSHETCLLDAPDSRVGQLTAKIYHFNDETFVERLGKNLNYAGETAGTIIESGKTVRWYHILLYPSYRFFKAYIYERAIFAGVTGLIFSLQTFCGTFNWYAIAWDRQNYIERKKLEETIE